MKIIDRNHLELRALLASIDANPLPMILTDPGQDDNPVIAVNAAFTRLTLYHSTEILGRNCRFLTGPATDPAASSRLRDAVGNRQSVVVELLNYRRDGSTFRNAVMIAPWYDPAGNLRFFVGSQMECDPNSLLRDRLSEAQALIRRITPRQRSVLTLMAKGMRNRQIGIQLGIGEKTVKMHRADLVKRLDAASSTHAIRIAIEAELVTD